MKVVSTTAAILLALGLSAPSVRASDAKEVRPLFREGEVIVKFASGALKGTVVTATMAMRSMAARADSRAEIAKTLAVSGPADRALIRFPKDASVASMVARFKAMPGVEYAEPNYLAYIPDLPQARPTNRASRLVRDEKTRLSRTMTPTEVKTQSLADTNDPFLANQAGWLWAEADIVWPDAKLNPMIAILDTGVDYTHPDLAGLVVKGTDWINGDNDPMDDNGHGTHCAGIAAARSNNKLGIAGISRAKIYAVKVLSGEGIGTYFDIASGILQAANYPLVKVISMSFGGSVDSLTLSTAVDYAVNTKKKLIVAAAGNGDAGDGADTPIWPAFYANTDPSGSVSCASGCSVYPTLAEKVMAVAADGMFFFTDTTHETVDHVDYLCKAQYSNYGDWVSITAPGSDIYSTTPYNKPFWLNRYGGVLPNYDFLSGTSMATPMVAGAASRLLSTSAALTNADVKDQLVSSGYDTSGLIGLSQDVDGDAAPDTDCWPTGSNPLMTDLTVAGAMQRGSVKGSVNDAANGNALVGAKVVAYLGTAVKGYGGTVDSGLTEFFRIVNLPWSGLSDYTFKVQKAGYTAGGQTYISAPVNDTIPSFLPPVSVPPAKNRWFVTDWTGESVPGVPYELDQYLYTPKPAPISCSVGFFGSCGIGSLTTAPFIRSMHDGGPFVGSTPMESTAARPPLYATPDGSTPYELFVDSYDDTDGSLNLQGSGAIARIWLNGAIKGTVKVDLATDLGTCVDSTAPNGADCAWHVGDMTGAGLFTPVNELGAFCHAGEAPCPAGVTTPGIAPYSLASPRVSLALAGARRKGASKP